MTTLARAASPVEPGRRRALPFVFAALAAACTEVVSDGRIEPAITLEVEPPSGVVGTAFRFSYEAQGSLLRVVYIAYGDGAVDTIKGLQDEPVRGLGGHLMHTYKAPGSYQALGWYVLTTGLRDTARVSAQVTEGVGASRR